MNCGKPWEIRKGDLLQDRGWIYRVPWWELWEGNFKEIFYSVGRGLSNLERFSFVILYSPSILTRVALKIIV
jgi:hypothetical protein